MWFSRPGHLLPLLRGPCPLLALSAEDKGQNGHPDWMQPHTQQTVMRCVFWHLSIRTNMNSFSNLSNSSSSVGLDHTGQPSLLMCINEPWPPMTLSPDHYCSFLGPLLIDTDHCRLGTSHKSCSFGDILTWSSSHHNVALVKLASILTLTHFSCIYHINFEDNMFTCCLIYPTH